MDQTLKQKFNWLNRFQHKLSEMLSGADGFWSAMRWITVSTANMIMAVWVIISLLKCALQPIPESVVTIFFVCVTGKLLQHTSETKESITNGKDNSDQDKESDPVKPQEQPTT